MIEVQGVSKSFGAVCALKNIDLSIARGERLALVGANGSGKTTLLRAILGLLRVKGRVLIDGTDVARNPDAALRNVAYVPQIAPPLEAPVSEVVRALCALRGMEMEQVLQCARRLGLSLETSANVRFRDLSGGMKQKLLAATALATCARIIVCDEPTANLDAAARESFFEQLSENNDGKIVILCSHRAEEIRKLVDRVVELEDGVIKRDVQSAELLSHEKGEWLEKPEPSRGTAERLQPKLRRII